MSILVQFCNWIVINFVGENGVSSIASVGTIIALIIAIIKYLDRSKQQETDRIEKEKNERTRASKNIHIELQDAREALDRAKYGDDAKSFILHKKEYFFMNRTFNHDFYDSLVSSGKINFLKSDLQQPLQNIFQTIKIHNKYLDLVDTMYDQNSENKIPDKSLKYYQWMDENEIKLMEAIPIMQKKLEEYFKSTSF